MNKGSAKSPAVIGKLAILVLGVIVLGVGLHSHFKSTWTDTFTILLKEYHLYDVCTNTEQFRQQFGQLLDLDLSCPPIAYEKYFVAMIIICFLVSLLDFVAGFFIDLKSSPLKLVDLGCHVLLAVLLIIASCLYLVSGIQIKNLYESTGFTESSLKKLDINMLTTEKLAAGALGIIQSLLYAIVAVLIAKQ